MFGRVNRASSRSGPYPGEKGSGSSANPGCASDGKSAHAPALRCVSVHREKAELTTYLNRGWENPHSSGFSRRLRMAAHWASDNEALSSQLQYRSHDRATPWYPAGTVQPAPHSSNLAMLVRGLPSRRQHRLVLPPTPLGRLPRPCPRYRSAGKCERALL